MKFKTKVIISFCIIIFVPIVLAVLVLFGFLRRLWLGRCVGGWWLVRGWGDFGWVWVCVCVLWRGVCVCVCVCVCVPLPCVCVCVCVCVCLCGVCVCVCVCG